MRERERGGGGELLRESDGSCNVTKAAADP